MVKSGEKYVAALTAAIRRLHDEVSGLIQGFDAKPQVGSLANHEIQSFSKPVLISTAYRQGQQRIHVAADHLIALTRRLDEPVLPIACWTAVRAVLEASAIAAWLTRSGDQQGGACPTKLYGAI